MPRASASNLEEEPQAAAVTNTASVPAGAQSRAVSRISGDVIGREKSAEEDSL